ncbi:hypothetical protein BDD43_5426 [Mucilaginibacter gracilis]|uniref:Uncharacterized protein n=1 Tax=Mucilaginibacter gracilis TaxID=423350 RepID=A0A495J861_9SPHI|nr:hypothetical protein BDD43_5426 [Mucilaginibacter gracilis]
MARNRIKIIDTGLIIICGWFIKMDLGVPGNYPNKGNFYTFIGIYISTL